MFDCHMDLLEEILEAEHETATGVEVERSAIATWLDHIKRTIADAAATAVAHIERSVLDAVAAARVTADQRAAAMVERAASEAKRLETLDASQLQSIVWRQLQTIVPGRARDCADVED